MCSKHVHVEQNLSHEVNRWWWKLSAKIVI